MVAVTLRGIETNRPRGGQTLVNWQDTLKTQVVALEELLGDRTLCADIDGALELSRSIRGFLFFTGIGRSGFVVAKVASTFNSLGIRNMLARDELSFYSQRLIRTFNRAVEICGDEWWKAVLQSVLLGERLSSDNFPPLHSMIQGGN